MELLHPDWQIQELPALRGFTVEWAEPGYYVLSRRHQLYETTALDAPLKRLGAFPSPAWKSIISRFRYAQRLLRFMFYNVLRLPDQSLFLTFNKSVGRYVDGQFHPLKGLARSTRILRSGCVLGVDGFVYFGEYLGNEERGSIRIYRYQPGEDRLEIIYTFEAGTIRHVHGIYRDPYTDALWCVTGDVGDECRIMRTEDGFQTLEVVGTGDESWRTVSLLFSPDALYYGSDAEFEQNYIYRIDRASGQRDRLDSLEGPVYYSYQNATDCYLAVTAEGCPSQIEFIASIWHVDQAGCRRVMKIKKDWGHPGYLMPGTLHFPQGPGLGQIVLFHTVALQGDNRLFCLKGPAVR